MKGIITAMTFTISLAAAAVGGSSTGSSALGAKGAVLYHASYRGSYVAGTYDGAFSMDQLRQHGDFGLGATDGNDGELVALGGIFWRSRADGTMSELAPGETTPYAVMTFFRPERTLHFTGITTSEDLEKKLDAELDTAHRVYAVRIRGRFASVDAGNGARQEKPHRLLEQVLAEYHYRNFAPTQGTLVGFRCPPYMRDLDRVGYHFHYLSDDHKQGGHVRGYAVQDVEVAVQELSGFAVDLPPKGNEFYERKLQP